mmetsp:Transcript_847/g.1833  ORF Transcript_847/g.1833 Transcript_847/m.1833 type:complete len:405 (+) Transcript_847:780-1994(+)
MHAAKASLATGARDWAVSRRRSSALRAPMSERLTGWPRLSAPRGIESWGRPAADASIASRITLPLQASRILPGAPFLGGGSGMVGSSRTLPRLRASLRAFPSVSMALAAASTRPPSGEASACCLNPRAVSTRRLAALPIFLRSAFLWKDSNAAAASISIFLRPADITASTAENEGPPSAPSPSAPTPLSSKALSSGTCLSKKFSTFTRATFAAPRSLAALTWATSARTCAYSAGSQDRIRSCAIRNLAGALAPVPFSLAERSTRPTWLSRAGSHANQPTVSKDAARGSTPAVLTAPMVGRMPKTPQQAAGMRTLPQVSVPRAKSQRPAATAAALPLEEPPGTSAGKAGFLGPRLGWCGFSPSAPKASSSSQVFPTPLAPALSSASTQGACAFAGLARSRHAGHP